MAKRYESPYKVDIPPVDLATFIFSSQTPEDRLKPQYFDADRPERCFSLHQAEILVKRLGKGLQDLGLKPNDKLLLYSGNSLYFPILFWGTVAAGCVFTGCSPSASVTGMHAKGIARLSWDTANLTSFRIGISIEGLGRRSTCDKFCLCL